MPYIKEDDRLHYAVDLAALIARFQENGCSGGDFNYLVTNLLLVMIGPKESWNYSKLSFAVGQLTCIQLEFYRRVVEQYEGEKIAENGDVYNA